MCYQSDATNQMPKRHVDPEYTCPIIAVIVLRDDLPVSVSGNVSRSQWIWTALFLFQWIWTAWTLYESIKPDYPQKPETIYLVEISLNIIIKTVDDGNQQSNKSHTTHKKSLRGEIAGDRTLPETRKA